MSYETGRTSYDIGRESKKEEKKEEKKKHPKLRALTLVGGMVLGGFKGDSESSPHVLTETVESILRQRDPVSEIVREKLNHFVVEEQKENKIDPKSNQDKQPAVLPELLDLEKRLDAFAEELARDKKELTRLRDIYRELTDVYNALENTDKGFNADGVHYKDMTHEQIVDFIDYGEELKQRRNDLLLSLPEYAEVNRKYQDLSAEWMQMPGQWDELGTDTRTLASLDGFMGTQELSGPSLQVKVFVGQDGQYGLKGVVTDGETETRYEDTYPSKQEVLKAIEVMRQEYEEKKAE